MVQTCFIYLESLKEGTQADKHFQCFANIHGLVFQQSLKKHYICAIYITSMQRKHGRNCTRSKIFRLKPVTGDRVISMLDSYMRKVFVSRSNLASYLC